MKWMKAVILFAILIPVISVIYADSKPARSAASVQQQRAKIMHGRTPSMSPPARSQPRNVSAPQHAQRSQVVHPKVQNAGNARIQNLRQGVQNRNISRPAQPHVNVQNNARADFFKNAIPAQRKINREHASKANNQFRSNNPQHREWFGDDFNRRHHYKPNYHGGHRWGGANWGQISNWGGWGWNYPIYYSDGGAYDVPPTEMNIVNDYSTNDYSSNVYNVQNDYSQPQDPIQGEWLPLGVFAAGMDTMQAAYSNMVVQLALNKNGEIAGTYYNAASDETHPLEGMVDRDTQMAYWRVADKDDSTIISAGLYNLTQDVVDVQVHFADGSEQKWVFVRLNEAN